MKKIVFCVIALVGAALWAWDPALDTARTVDYLSDWEKDVIFEMNKVRNNPVRYANEVLRPLVRLYRGKIAHWPDQIPIETIEGVRALNEAIRELENLRGGLEPIRPSRGMSLAARDHARDQSRTGALGHDGADGSDPFKRMNRYGNWTGSAGENIEYGSSNGAQSVIFLLIDDGVPDRGHRKNILNGRFRVAGVATENHPVYETVTVTTFASGYRERSD